MATTTKPDEDKTATQAKEVAQKAPEPTAKVKDTGAPVKPVMALHRINGTIEPLTPFRPANAQELADLESLHAVRDLTEAEQALFDRLETPAADDTLG